jgi:uridine kinase
MSFVVAICGGSGSGKSLLCQALQKSFLSESVVFPYDAYNKDQSRLSQAERDQINYDVPAAYDQDLFLADLLTLKAGKNIALPTFDYPTHTRKKETIPLASKPLILAEGFLLFAIPEKRRYFDYLVYVDADPDVRLARRIARDATERGYPLKQVLWQYFSSVKPMHERYIEAYKKDADFLFENNGEHGLDEKRYRELVDEIRSRVNQKR